MNLTPRIASDRASLQNRPALHWGTGLLLAAACLVAEGCSHPMKFASGRLPYKGDEQQDPFLAKSAPAGSDRTVTERADIARGGNTSLLPTTSRQSPNFGAQQHAAAQPPAFQQQSPYGQSSIQAAPSTLSPGNPFAGTQPATHGQQVAYAPQAGYGQQVTYPPQGTTTPAAYPPALPQQLPAAQPGQYPPGMYTAGPPATGQFATNAYPAASAPAGQMPPGQTPPTFSNGVTQAGFSPEAFGFAPTGVPAAGQPPVAQTAWTSPATTQTSSYPPGTVAPGNYPAGTFPPAAPPADSWQTVPANFGQSTTTEEFLPPRR